MMRPLTGFRSCWSTRLLVYGLLTLLLALIYVGSVVLLQALVRAVTGQESTLAIVLATLAAAALVQPVRRQLQRRLDRRFGQRL